MLKKGNIENKNEKGNNQLKRKTDNGNNNNLAPKVFRLKIKSQ
jgi:hypothetical protein